MLNENIRKKISNSGLLVETILDDCWEQTYTNPRFSQQKDLAKVIVALGYLTQGQIDDILNESEWDLQDDPSYTIHDEEEESFVAAKDMRTLMKVDTARKYKSDFDDDNIAKKVPKKILRPISSRVKKIG